MIGGSYLTQDERFAAALAALGAGPARLRTWLADDEPRRAWVAIAAGRHPADPRHTYRSKARLSLVTAVEQACVAGALRVRLRGGPGYPASLCADPDAPAVLFTRGDLAAVDTRPRVAVVGTRSATPYGLAVAAELGRELAAAGVTVVSGLAPGIDAAAHGGAVAVAGGGPPLAVLGPAHDAAMSRLDRRLFLAIGERGAVVSERPPGTPATPPWCFAVRNRVIAALAHVVVVVECHRQGGSLHTVKAALRRGIPVMAVPGSVRSSASAGCNGLLVDGAAPARHADDVLSALELAICARPEVCAPDRRPTVALPPRHKPRPVPPPPGSPADRVLQSLDQDPASLDAVVGRSGLAVAEVAEALEVLSAAGLAAGTDGWWYRGGSEELEV